MGVNNFQRIGSRQQKTFSFLQTGEGVFSHRLALSECDFCYFSGGSWRIIDVGEVGYRRQQACTGTRCG